MIPAGQADKWHGLQGYNEPRDHSMAITIICPNLLCRGILQVPDSVRGRKVRCGKCGKDLLVPAAVQEEPKKPTKTADPAVAAPAEQKPD